MKKIIIKLHNFTGTIMSTLFLMWFISGLVLIFIGFPFSSKENKFSHLEPISIQDINSVDSIPKVNCSKFELEKLDNKVIFRIYKGSRNKIILDAKSLKPIERFSKIDAKNIAKNYSKGEVKNIKIINDLTIWVPWGSYSRFLPIYKCEIDDTKGSVLYVSSKTGTVVQNTTSKTRFFAYIGAIPHYILFKYLRSKIWSKTVIIIISIGIFVCISGIFVGFFRLKKRKHKGITPYKKKWYKWHHLAGFFFGIFALTFIFSGLTLMTSIPDWVVERNPESYKISHWNQNLDISQHSLAPKEIWLNLNITNGLRKLSWKTVMDKPAYFAYYKEYKNPDVYIYDNTSLHKNIRFSNKEILHWAKKIFPNKNCSLELLTEYDYQYKKSSSRNRILPVYKLSLNNKYNTELYINPISGQKIKSIDNYSKIKRFCFTALHRFDFPFIDKHQWLRITLLIIISIAGIILSLTGCVLSINWIKRSRKRKVKKLK